MKFMKRIVAIFSALLLLAGCTIDSPVVYDPDLKLLFLPEVYRHVGNASLDRYPDTQDFAVCAWVSGEKWLGLSRASSKEILLTDTLSGTPVMDTLWALEEDVLWPSKDKRVTFYAYSPYEEECTMSYDKGVEWSTDVLERQTDLLYSHLQVDRKGNVNGNVAHLCFSHALCQLTFKVKNRVDNTGALDPLNRPDKITIKKITIDGVKHKGTFRSLPSPEWILHEDEAPLPVFEGRFQTAGVPQAIGKVWLMVPQKFDTSITVEFEYTTFANTTITHEIKTVPMSTILETGRDYTYTLSVGIDDVKFLKELIGDSLNNE